MAELPSWIWKEERGDVTMFFARTDDGELIHCDVLTSSIDEKINEFCTKQLASAICWKKFQVEMRGFPLRMARVAVGQEKLSRGDREIIEFQQKLEGKSIYSDLLSI